MLIHFMGHKLHYPKGGYRMNSAWRPSLTNVGRKLFSIPVPKQIQSVLLIYRYFGARHRTYICAVWRRFALGKCRQYPNRLRTAITARLALVSIVVASLMFAFGEGGSTRTLFSVVFGVDMAIAAVNFMALSRVA